MWWQEFGLCSYIHLSKLSKHHLNFMYSIVCKWNNFTGLNKRKDLQYFTEHIHLWLSSKQREWYGSSRYRQVWGPERGLAPGILFQSHRMYLACGLRVTDLWVRNLSFSRLWENIFSSFLFPSSHISKPVWLNHYIRYKW